MFALKKENTYDNIVRDRQLSYKAPYNSQQYYWVVDMHRRRLPSASGDGDDEVETLVLFKSLALLRAEVIRGRATRIWKAWTKDDMDKPKDERKVGLW